MLWWKCGHLQIASILNVYYLNRGFIASVAWTCAFDNLLTGAFNLPTQL